MEVPKPFAINQSINQLIKTILLVPDGCFRFLFRASEIITKGKVIPGHAMALLVEALRYKSEGRGFDYRWCHWIFPLTYSFRPHYGPGVDSVSNRNKYQEYFLGVKMAGA
jgi:hypothetical protein